MKAPREEVIREPMSNELITVINDVVKLVRPARAMIGQVRIINSALKEVDLSELMEAEALDEFPQGLEMITMQCDHHFPVIPVRFVYRGVQYSDMWFYAKDLQYVAGLHGHHLNGGEDV